MKQIPFHAVEPGYTAIEAVYRMLFEYYLNRKLSSADVAAMPDPLTSMVRQGFEVQEIDQPTAADLDRLLSGDNLVMVEAALEPDNEPRALLIFQGDNKNFFLHDPGLPAQPNFQISRETLQQALAANPGAPAFGIIFRKSHVAKRLDSYVVNEKPQLSRAFAAKLIEQGRVLVNGQTKKPGYKVRTHDQVSVDYNDSELDDIPHIDLPVLYEDDDCVVMNKPAGVLTHAQGKHIAEATVATFLREHTANLDGERAGIVHRLDRATSGVIIGAKHPAALQFLMSQFADRKAKKTYVAIVRGHFKTPEALVDVPIERNPKSPSTYRAGANGKPSQTYYKVLQESATASLVELQPRSGRTHQLRVHMSHLGHPIIGDPLYGEGQYTDRLYLHARSLQITLPNGKEQTFTAPLPPEFTEYLHG